jgi:succinylglutamic semialdehyde dehydrogenase
MAVFGPFNFPGHLPNGHIVPALLAGNTIVFKPSEHAPKVGALFAKLAEAAGLPKGVLNIVQGARDTGAALLDQDINGVLFTGSANTGTYFHKLFAGRPNVILALEMGGNNPLILHDAQDVDAAADIAFVSAYISAGQRCSCARRLMLPTGAWGDAVIEKIKTRIANVKVGDPMSDVFMGTVVDAKQAERALAYEADLIAKGATALTSFVRPDPNGAYLRPSLIDVTHTTNIEDEELFAPLLQVRRIDGIDAMIAAANDTRFGLSAGIVTDDAALWDYTRPRLRAGIVNWNKPTTGAASSMPFGGPGLSGNFRPGAYYAADYCAWPQASQLGDTPMSPSLPNF